MDLTQSELAEMLDVPVNTLSRWETAKTTPDAHALAAIYSVASEHGIEPQFFESREPHMTALRRRKNLNVAWDVQNLPPVAEQVKMEWHWMERFLSALFPGSASNPTLTAYALPFRWQSNQPLEELGFNVKTSFDADSQLIRDAESLYGIQARRNYVRMVPFNNSLLSQEPLDPRESIFVLIANDGDYLDLLKDLTDKGVEVYLWADEEQVNERLRRTVGDEQFIHWERPYIVMRCVDALISMNGKTTTMSDFGNQCELLFDQDGYHVYPVDAGFSRNHPYRSVLRFLERLGIAKARSVGGKSSKFRFSVSPTLMIQE